MEASGDLIPARTGQRVLSRQEWLFYWLRKIALMSLICSNRATWIFFSRWLDLRIHEEEQALHLSGDQMCEDFPGFAPCSRESFIDTLSGLYLP